MADGSVQSAGVTTLTSGASKFDEVMKCLHELVAIQQTFKSYERLANGEYRFHASQFKKAALKIQEVIDMGRHLASQIKEEQ